MVRGAVEQILKVLLYLLQFHQPFLAALLVPFSFSQHRRSFLNFPLLAPFLPVLKNTLVLISWSTARLSFHRRLWLSSPSPPQDSYSTLLFVRSWNQLVSRVPPKKTQSLMSVCHLSGRGLVLELRSWCRRETALRPPQIIPLNPSLLTEVGGAPFCREIWVVSYRSYFVDLTVEFSKMREVGSKNQLPKWISENNVLLKMYFRKCTSEILTSEISTSEISTSEIWLPKFDFRNFDFRNFDFRNFDFRNFPSNPIYRIWLAALVRWIYILTFTILLSVVASVKFFATHSRGFKSLRKK